MKKLIVVEDEFDFKKCDEFDSFVKEHFTEKITDEIEFSKDLNAILMHQNNECDLNDEKDAKRFLLLDSLADYSLKATYYNDVNIIKQFFDEHKNAILYLDFPSAPKSIPNVKLNGKITLKNDVLTIPLKILPDDCQWCFRPANGANFRGPRCDFCGGDLDHGGELHFANPFEILNFLRTELRKNNYPFDVIFSKCDCPIDNITELLKTYMNFNKNIKHFLTNKNFLFFDSNDFHQLENIIMCDRDFREELKVLFVVNNKVVCCYEESYLLFECNYYDCNSIIRESIIPTISQDNPIVKVIIDIMKKIKEKAEIAVTKRVKTRNKDDFKLFKKRTSEIAKKQRKKYTNIVHGDADGILILAYNQTLNEKLIIADDVVQIGSRTVGCPWGMPKYAYCNIYPNWYFATFSTIPSILTHLKIQMSDSVKIIESCGFRFKSDKYVYLENLNISNNVAELKSDTFNCIVEKISFGENIKKIGKRCFLWIPKEIFYNGNSKNFRKYGNMWFAIRHGDGKTVVHCNDKDLFI